MVGKTLELETLVYDRDSLASAISQRYDEWQSMRLTWMQEKTELRNYLFATDTTKTSNSKLPWKNSTTLPKLTQIRDNLHANYLAALFPNRDWLAWEGNDANDESKEKSQAIQAYMQTKHRQDNAITVFSQLLLDYIDYGNCFATVDWVDDSIEGKDGIKRGYVGPRYVRISPYDIVFNPLAPRFEDAPKITRAITDIGEMVKMRNKMAEGDEKNKLSAAIERSLETRKSVRAMTTGESLKYDGFIFDGFGSAQEYYNSDSVEILTFYGDIFDINTGEMYVNHKIMIMDRSYVISAEENTHWVNNSGIFHVGWRMRPDNLYAMGPLDNLVGLQYRIDHLENIKADAYDLLAFPVMKVSGYVKDFDYAPGERIDVGEEGDVNFVNTDLGAIVSAETQIQMYMEMMEQLAGAPRDAMGIRTPGEKTKFEVQKLDNAASRIFQNKTEHFEREFLTKLINYALSLARQNMSANDTVRTLDSEVEAVIFSKVTQDDITANGILRPVGSSHFARKANILQNIVGLSNTSVYQDPAVNVHLSGKKLAKLIEELSDLDEFKIFSDNIRVAEQGETQRFINGAADRAQQAALTPNEISPAGI